MSKRIRCIFSSVSSYWFAVNNAIVYCAKHFIIFYCYYTDTAYSKQCSMLVWCQIFCILMKNAQQFSLVFGAKLVIMELVVVVVVAVEIDGCLSIAFFIIRLIFINGSLFQCVNPARPKWKSNLLSFMDRYTDRTAVYCIVVIFYQLLFDTSILHSV